MSNINIIKTVRQENIGSDDKLKAAKSTLDLKRQELEIAQKAVKEARAYMDFLIDKSFKEIGLKAMEGEIIHIPEYDLLYFWANGKLVSLPTSILGGTSNE